MIIGRADLLVCLALVCTPLGTATAGDCRSALEAIFDEESHPDLRWSSFARMSAQVRTVYERSDYGPLWLRGGGLSLQGSQVVDLLHNADRKGLNPKDYDGDRWRERATRVAAASAPEGSCEGAILDLGLTISAMRYLEHLRIGRVDPKALNIGLDVSSKQFDLPAFVGELAQSQEVAKKAAEVEPHYDLYWALLDALKLYQELSRDATLNEPLPEIGKLQPGESYRGLAALSSRLKRYGDLHSEEAAKVRRDIFSEPLVRAVKRFQERHGLKPDGVIGNKTFAYLNTPATERLKQIELTLERTRWLPTDLGERPIIVNVPEYRLYALKKGGRDGKYDVALEMQVIVGEAYPRHQTPIFSGKMINLEFSPYWNVPYSILRRELYPKIQADPSYISRNGYQIVSQFGPRATPLDATGDNLARLSRGELRLRQVPGKRNALGEVKFLFPNQHSVYLHGTPGKRLFAQEQRDFSHGCIRLQDAPRMAEYVLQAEQGWSRDRIDKLIASGEWRNVNLSQPLEVYILYGSAVVDRGSGKVRFFHDIYGHDAKLAQALAAVYR